MRKHISSILAFVALCCVCTGSAFAAHGSVWPLQTRIDEIAAKGGGTLMPRMSALDLEAPFR